MNKLNYLSKYGKKIGKFLISMSIALTTCITSDIGNINVVEAAGEKQTFYIETTDDGSSIGSYLGVDGVKIVGHVIKGGDDSIAYCLSHGLKFPHDSHSDNPTIYSKSSDDTVDWSWYMTNSRQPTQAQVKLIQKALYAGYPTKLPTEMGFSDNSKERAAYYATQVAIWNILEGWGDRVYKLEGSNDEENNIINEIWTAYQKIMTFVNSDKTGFSPELIITNTSNRNRIETLKLAIPEGRDYKESEALTVRPLQDGAYATDDKLGLSFSVGFEGDVPEGAKIVDSNGNECYDFGQGTDNGTIFKIRIPADTTFNGNFKVVVSGTFVRNAPVIWNTANTAYQTLMQFGAVNSSSDTELTVIETGNATGTIVFNKKAQVPSGYDSMYSDENYGESPLLINEIKYSYLPKAGIQFSVYYAEDTNEHFANELAGRGTTDSNGRLVMTVPLAKDRETTKFYAKETKAPAGIQLDTNKTYNISITKGQNGETATVNVTNDAVKAYLTLNKKIEVLENGQSIIKNAGQGIQFGVYLNKADFGLAKDSLLKIVETDSNGVVNTGYLPLNGSYYLKELKTLNNYSLDTTKYTFDLVADTLTSNSTKPLHFYQVTDNENKIVEDITNYIQKLNLTIKKNIQYVDDNGNIKSRAITKEEADLFEFTVYSDNKATQKVGTMKYDEVVGGYVLGELDTAKTYYVKETKSPDIYEMNDEIYSMNIDSSTKTITNELSLGSILIKKHDKDTGEMMSGIEFTLTGKNAQGKTLITKKLKTDANGQVKFEKLPASLKYTVVETVPTGYKNITGNINVDFLTTKATDIEKDVYNQEIVTDINIKVIKTNELKTVKLSDVSFELYKKSDMSKVIASGKTDSNGELRFNKLEKDVYVLKEVATKAHYELPTGDDALTTIDLTGVEDVYTKVVNITNKSIPLNIELLKVEGESSAISYLANMKPVINSNEKPLAGVTFNLYRVADGIQEFVAKGTTNSEGKIIFTDSDKIIYGETYILKETPHEGYSPLKDLTFTIANDIQEDTVYIKAVNQKFKGEINIIKTDGKTTKPIKNVEFKLYKDRTLVSTKTTDENGKITFEDLVEGNYSVIESKTGDAYILDTSPKNIVLDAEHPSVTVEFVNKRKPITINILKTIGDEEKVTVNKGNKSENLSNNDVSLDGVEFSIYEGKTLIDKAVTKDGKVTFDSDKLMVGVEYTIKETKTPTGYKPVDDINVIIEMDEANSFSVINVKVQNKLVKNVIELYKFDNGTKEPIEGTEITLYRTPTGSDKSDIVAVAKTDKDGIARFEGLVNGTYYLEETKPSVGYINKDMERIPVTFDGSEFAIKKVSLDNERKTIDVVIHKEDRETKDKLQNAGFALYQINNGVEKLISEGITDENGELRFTGLAVGYMYKLVETRAPSGYDEPIKNFVYFEVPMNSESTSLTLTVENDKIKEENPEFTKIKIIKLDEDNPNVKLANAEFEIYKIVKNQEILVDKGITDSNGEFLSKNLDRGYSYKIVETKQPEGYDMPENNVTIVNIDEKTDEKIITKTISNKKLVNTVSLKIVKVDDEDNDIKLKGAEFSIYKKIEDNKISLIAKGKTDENGELIFAGLEKGQTYTVLETKAPENYMIKGLASADVTIDKDEKELIIEHVRENTKIEKTTPQTGDVDKNLPFMIIAGAATVVFVSGGIYLYIRKRKNK